MRKSYPTHGGKREGAGRKPGIPNAKPSEPQTTTKSFSLSEDALQALQVLVTAWKVPSASKAVDRALIEAAAKLEKPAE